jgi:hypothetical protein
LTQIAVFKPTYTVPYKKESKGEIGQTSAAHGSRSAKAKRVPLDNVYTIASYTNLESKIVNTLKQLYMPKE